MLFATGVVAGVAAGSIERGAMKPLAGAILLAALAVAVLCGWLLRRSLPVIFAQTSPRVGKARRMAVLSGVIGALIGMLMVLGSVWAGEEPPSLFSNAPLPGFVALIAIAALLLLVPPITYIWHRSIDEHEALAYRDGTLAGIYAYCAIAPTWWLGWRGGFLPEPQEMITFLIVVAVWGIVWTVRRYG
ncbi:MAG: hypothetical protein ACEQR8_00625 [Cypionkella sp.]